MAKTNAPPLNLNPKPPTPIVAGLRVEATHGKKTVYGVVKSIRTNRGTVVLDGGREQISGPLGAFRPSAHPLPKDEPNVMDKWGVVKYKALKVVDEPGGYNAEVTLNGVAVIQAYNQGHGGPDNFQPLKGQTHKVTAQLAADATAWASQHTDGKVSEVEGLWVEWFVNSRPYGVLAKQYLAPFLTSKDEEEKAAKERADFQRAEQEQERAAADKIGVKVLCGREEARELKLPARFKREHVTNYAVLVDTVTGRGVSVGLCDLGGAIKVLAAMFPDEPKQLVVGTLDAKRLAKAEAMFQQDERLAKAEAMFQQDELDGFTVASMDGWESSGDRFQRVFYADNEAGGDSIRKVYAVQFYPGSEQLVSSGVEVRSPARRDGQCGADAHGTTLEQAMFDSVQDRDEFVRWFREQRDADGPFTDWDRERYVEALRQQHLGNWYGIDLPVYAGRVGQAVQVLIMPNEPLIAVRLDEKTTVDVVPARLVPATDPSNPAAG